MKRPAGEMQDRKSTHPPLWISDTDRHGRPVRRPVIEAAYRIWGRVLDHLQQQRQDVAPAAEVLEATCHSVSRAVSRKSKANPVRNLDSYLFWAFIRAHRRRVAKERRIQYVESVEALEKPDDSWASMLENEIQLKELLGYLDPKAREMLMGRIAGHSWKEIGESLGLTAHNAEVQFAYAIKNARRRLFGVGPDKSGRRDR
jgi:RNA polymerase sigma factor (sigma-70 family)